METEVRIEIPLNLIMSIALLVITKGGLMIILAHADAITILYTIER